MKNFKFLNSLRAKNQRPHDQSRVINYQGGRIEVQWNEKNEPAQIAILDTIGKDPWSDGGFTESDFRNALKDIPRSKELNILVNSKGGDVFEGFGIKNAIAEWPNKVTATISGVAASTASWMILDADEIRATRASQMFIHEAMTNGVGNADEMREVADRLDKTSDQIAGFYAAKNGKSVSEMRDRMKRNTLMTGAEAKELGLVDVLTDEKPTRNFSEADIRNMEARILNTFATPQGQQKNNQPQPQDTNVNRTQKIALLNSWGLTIKDEAAVTDARLDELVNFGKVTASASFTKHGNAMHVNETTTATNAAPASTAATQTANTQPSADVLELRNEIKRLKETRITDTFNTIAATRPTVAENREEYLKKCLNDETLLEVYKNFPETPEPMNIGNRTITVVGNPTIESFNKFKPGAARRAWLTDGDNNQQLINQWRKFNPQNANTQDAALVTAYLSDSIVTVAPSRLAMLSTFVRNVTLNPIKKGKVEVQYATVGATGSQNPTNFQSGNSTMAKVEVSVNHENLSYHVSNDDRHNGLTLASFADINADKYSYQLSDIITGLMLTASYGTPLTIGTAANFDPDDLSPVLAVAKNYRQVNLLLDGGHLAYITPKLTTNLDWNTSGAFGFNKINPQNRWTGATANTVGFVSGPDAIAIAAGAVGDVPAQYYESIQDVQVLGFPVKIHVWFDTLSREHWFSFGCMFGGAAADTTQGKGLVTA